MWLSLKEHLGRVISVWSTVVLGFIGGVLFIGEKLWPKQFAKIVDPAISPWVWGSVFLAALMYGQFRAFHDVRLERERHLPKGAKPDAAIHKALDYLRNEGGMGQDADPYSVLQEVRQAAVDNDITIWGRRITGNAIIADKPLIPIEAQYWREHGFHAARCWTPTDEVEGGGRTEMDGYRIGPELAYDDLRVSMQQIRSRWPARIAL